jgi:hypothetical protein
MPFLSSTVVIEYDGSDISDHVLWESASFESQMGAVPGIFSFECKDEEQELSFVTGKRITLDVDGVRLFGGFLTQVTRDPSIFPADHIPADPTDYRNRTWQLAGVSYNILFDRLILHNSADHLHQIPAVSDVYDGALIRSYLPDYIDEPGDLDMSTYVDDIKHYDSYTWKQQGTQWREVMENWTQWTGALVYIDGSMNLHHQELDTTIKRWGFSDKPNNDSITALPLDYQDATIGMREVEASEDGSVIVNDAFIWGGGIFAGSGSTVFARETNSSSITDHGRWQLAETHFGEKDYGLQSGVDARADVIVNGPPGATPANQQRGLKYAQQQLRLAWFAHNVPRLSGSPDHIVPGELSTITLWVYSEDGGTTPLTRLLPMRSATITFPQINEDGSYVRFDGFFGLQPDDPYTLWRFLLRAQNRIIRESRPAATVNLESTGAFAGSVYFDAAVETPNGSITTFSIPFAYLAGSTKVYRNGLLQVRGTHYTESDPENGEISFYAAPLTGDNLLVDCVVAG